MAYDVLVLLLVFAVFAFAAPRVTRRTVRSARRLREAEHQYTHDAEEIQRRLEDGEAPPLGEDAPGEIVVFVSGHTHAPALTRFGDRGVIVNSGCWLRQLQPVPGRLGAPPVFVPRFVQTHVRVYNTTAGLEVELWEHPRQARQRLLLAERLPILRRLRAEPGTAEAPRVSARATG